mmetsp:Transcript_32255/g.48661  ORF Transcript_32255/g.48661 Transcript_32255/m.48661 type:complete len:111 (+) Transcript_32255:279-611(+)
MFYIFYITPDYPDLAVAIALEQMKERKMTGPNETMLYTLIGGDPNSHTPEFSRIIETIKSMNGAVAMMIKASYKIIQEMAVVACGNICTRAMKWIRCKLCGSIAWHIPMK